MVGALAGRHGSSWQKHSFLFSAGHFDRVECCALADLLLDWAIRPLIFRPARLPSFTADVSSGDQLGLGFQTVTRRVWTVQDLVSAVRSQLEREYTDVWVEGEISNFRPADSGHLYFTLKENGAQIRVVMFRMQARLLRFRPERRLPGSNLHFVNEIAALY